MHDVRAFKERIARTIMEPIHEVEKLVRKVVGHATWRDSDSSADARLFFDTTEKREEVVVGAEVGQLQGARTFADKTVPLGVLNDPLSVASVAFPRGQPSLPVPPSARSL